MLILKILPTTLKFMGSHSTGLVLRWEVISRITELRKCIRNMTRESRMLTVDPRATIKKGHMPTGSGNPLQSCQSIFKQSRSMEPELWTVFMSAGLDKLLKYRDYPIIIDIVNIRVQVIARIVHLLHSSSKSHFNERILK